MHVFKLKENVENFIAAIKDYGVPRHKLFSVSDLFDGKNILFFLFIQFTSLIHSFSLFFTLLLCFVYVLIVERYAKGSRGSCLAW